jgi:hypothetical protein
MQSIQEPRFEDLVAPHALGVFRVGLLVGLERFRSRSDPAHVALPELRLFPGTNATGQLGTRLREMVFSKLSLMRYY